MKIDIAKNLKKINLFFWLLILSLIAVNGISILIKKYFEFPDFIEAGNLFLYVNPLSMIICILLGYFVYNKFVEKGKNEEDNDLKFKEGAVRQITSNKYERNPQARKVCIEKYGTKCCVCGFDFETVYGKIGKDFIHVHHLTQVSTAKTEYEINPIEDLRPVCPNCHSMIHRTKTALTIEELKEKINNTVGNKS